MNAMKTSAAVISLALGFPAQAQLFSAYAEGATNPNAWLTDVTDGSFEEFDDPTTNAVADDEARRRIYYVVEGGTIFDERLQYRPVAPDGRILGAVDIGFIFDQGGLRIRRTRGLAFGDGVLYASNSSTGGNGAPRGLYQVDPESGDAALLFDPQFQCQAIVFSGLGFNDADGLLYGVASVSGGSSLFSIDLGSQVVTQVLDPSEIPGGPFDGVGIGNDRLYLTFGPSAVDIQVYNLSTGGFEAPLPNPPRGENGSGGATFASFLLSTEAVPLANPPAVAGLALALAGAGAMALRRRARERGVPNLGPDST